MDKKKFCIRIGDSIQEVTEEVYREYFKMERRERYLEERDLVNGKVLYSALDNVYEDVLGEDILVDSIVEDICELVTTKIKAKISVFSFASSMLFPFIRSISIAVEADEIAHPFPKKAASSIILSEFSFISNVRSSPQLGLCPLSI